MKTRCVMPLGLGAVVLLTLVAPPARAVVRAEDEAMLRAVVTRLLAAADPPPGMEWPPEVRLVDSGVVNACAFNTSRQPGVVKPAIEVYRGLMEQMIDGHADRLAYVVGHEMGHCLRGHIKEVYRDPKEGTAFLHATFTREQEFEADDVGMKLALKAGYNFRECLAALGVMVDRKGEYSAFRGQVHNHPSWKERLARLDTEHAALWTEMASFHSGVDFLEFEQFASAAACFDEVVRQFPDCPEAWANLGYAQLMQYCDTLTSDDLRKLDINQMVIGGFYRRPDWLRGETRGDDSKLWGLAKTSLEKALALKPDLSLTKANLGVVWLVAPDGKDVTRASKYLREAVHDMTHDPQMVPSLQAAVLVNTGVSDLAAGDDDLAKERLGRAVQLMGEPGGGGGGKAMAASFRSAVLYNQAVELSQSTTREKRALAVERFQEYFTVASPSGAWWPLAYERYSKLATDLGLPVTPVEKLRERASELKRPVTSVTLENGVELTLGEPLADVEKRLGPPAARLPIIADTNLVKTYYPKLGVQVIGIDRVLAIQLARTNSPAVMVRPAEIGAQPRPVRVGMPLQEVDKVVGPQRIAMEAVFYPGQTYVVYRDLQIAFRVADGKVSEIVVALIPETPREEKEKN